MIIDGHFLMFVLALFLMLCAGQVSAHAWWSQKLGEGEGPFILATFFLLVFAYLALPAFI